MPDELYIGTGSINVYLNIHRMNPSTGLWQIWKSSTSAWVSFTVGDIANYAMAATETNGNYVVNVTTSTGTGPMLFVWRQRAGGSVATSDVVLEKYNVIYDGVNSFIPVSTVPGGLTAAVSAGVGDFMLGGTGYDTIREIVWGADISNWSGLTGTAGEYLYVYVAKQSDLDLLAIDMSSTLSAANDTYAIASHVTYGNAAIRTAVNGVAAGVWLVSTASPTASTYGERLTRIPNAAAGGSGGLPTVDAANRIAGINGTITTLDGLNTSQNTQHTNTYNRIGAPTGASIAADIQTRATATGVWTVSTASPTAGTFGERLTRVPNAAAGGSGGLPTVDASNRIAGIAGTINTLDGLPTNSTVTTAVLAGLNADSGYSTLKTNAALSGNGTYGLSALKTILDTKASQSSVTATYDVTALIYAQGESLYAMTSIGLGDIPTNAEFAARTLPSADYATATVAAAVKAKTDNLPASPAATGAAMTLTAGERTAIVAANNASTPPAPYFTNAPSGGGGGGSSVGVLEETTIAEVLTPLTFRLTAGSTFDSYSKQTIILYDVSNNEYASVGTIDSYNGATKIVTLKSAPSFVNVAGDKVKILVSPSINVVGAGGTTINNLTEVRE